MKKTKELLAIVFFISTLLTIHSQNLEVTYKKKMSSKNQKKSSYVQKINASMEKKSYTLLINSNESIFNENKDVSDSNNLSNRISSILGGGDGIYYTNTKDKIVLHQKHLMGEDFLIQSKLKTSWTLLQDKVNIGGFECYKATIKKNKQTVSKGVISVDVIAWYCPSIPSSNGPVDFNGLPGLILKVQYDNIVFYAVEVKNVKQNKKIEIPNKGIKISEADYIEMLEKKSFEYRKMK